MTSGGDLRERDGPELPSRRALHDGAAVAAGALLAANLLHVRDSHALKPDILLSLAVVVALAAMLPLARHASVRSGMLAGAAVGAAVAAKYPGVILFVPLYAASVLGSSHRGWRRCFPAAVIWAGLAAAAVFLATSPFAIFDPESRDALESIVRLALAPLWAGSPEVPSQVAPALGGSGPGKPNWLEGLVYHTRSHCATAQVYCRRCSPPSRWSGVWHRDASYPCSAPCLRWSTSWSWRYPRGRDCLRAT